MFNWNSGSSFLRSSFSWGLCGVDIVAVDFLPPFCPVYRLDCPETHGVHAPFAGTSPSAFGRIEFRKITLNLSDATG